MRIQLTDDDGTEKSYEVALSADERDDGSMEVSHLNEDDVLTTTEFGPEWRITSVED